MLADLEKLDVSNPDFDTRLAAFERAVCDHADREEQEEFEQVLAGCEEAERQSMGTLLRAAEAVGPTHPHPSTAGSPVAQWAVGPFASLVDRTKDAIAKARS